MQLTKDETLACAEMLLGENPWDVQLPFVVARSLYVYESNKSTANLLWLKATLEEWSEVDGDAFLDNLETTLDLEDRSAEDDIAESEAGTSCANCQSWKTSTHCAECGA